MAPQQQDELLATRAGDSVDGHRDPGEQGGDVHRHVVTLVVAIAVVNPGDVSRSMLADNVGPDRLSPLRDAARRFIADLPEHFNIGLVGLAGAASGSYLR